jgi:signal transduction histidine kinase
MSRLPIRLRVAVAFAAAMAVVLAATGAIVYARLGDDLARALDTDLRLRAQDLATVVADPRGSLAVEAGRPLIERGESFAQLLSARGRVIDATAPLRRHTLLDAAQLARAGRAPLFIDRPSVPGLNEGARLLAVPVTRDGRPLVLVVGATRENRAETLRSLRTALLVAGPLALILATVLGYLLAGAGLRAVERMRRRAAGISADRPGERLPVPRTGDELERLGETLNAMLDRLEEARERERGFVAEASHELRTPLALLRAELDFALHHAETDEERLSALREASAETDRLVQLASDLLALASAEQGRLPLRLERVPAGDLLAGARRRFLWRAESLTRRIEIESPDGLVLEADRLRLEQALGNLVENALRHGQGTVRLRSRRVNGNAVELGVTDEGAGFPEDFRPRAFERFSRAEGHRSTPGSGLGLAVVEAIALAHGGTVKAAPANGAGCGVWITLPEAVR